MNIPLKKLKAIFKYFYTHTDKRVLGKKKMMKLFYFIDFWHVKKYGSPITYDNYINLEHGPIPSTILNMVNSVVDNPEAAVLSDTIQIQQECATGLHRIECLNEFEEKDKNLFSPSELKIMEDVATKFSNKTGGYVEKVSHAEYPWSSTKELDDIPYSLACKETDCEMNDKEVEMLKCLLNEK